MKKHLKSGVWNELETNDLKEDISVVIISTVILRAIIEEKFVWISEKDGKRLMLLWVAAIELN